MTSTSSSLRKTIMATLAVTALAITAGACGGDDADSAPAGPPDEPAAEPADEPDQESEAPDDSAGGAVATVTVGDLTYTFDLENGLAASCSVFAGETFFGTGSDADGATVGFEFPIEGSDRASEATPFIIVNDPATGSEWAAGTDDLRSFEPGTSQIDSVTVDGRTASGTATFIDASLDERVPTPGTFEATCP